MGCGYSAIQRAVEYTGDFMTNAVRRGSLRVIAIVAEAFSSTVDEGGRGRKGRDDQMKDVIQTIALIIGLAAIASFDIYLTGVAWLCFRETRQPERRNHRSLMNMTC